MTETHADRPDHAEVAIRPPLLLVLCVLTGLGLHALMPLRLAPEAVPYFALLALGLLLVALAFAVFAWAVRTMLAGGTSLPTNEPTDAIVSTGPYARTRNPIYLSMVLLQLGIAVSVNAAWLLATTAVFAGVVQVGVIVREERYLERKFGSAYTDYRARVRRWI